MARYQPRHSRGRTVRRSVTALMVLFVLVLGAAYLFRTGLISSLVSSASTDLGLGPATMKVTRADLTGFALEQVSSSSGQITADRVSGEYTLASILEGRLQSLTVEGLMVHTDWQEGGIDLLNRDRQPLPTPTELSTEPQPFPIDVISISNARAIIDHPAGPLSITGQLELRGGGNTFRVDGQTAIEGPDLEVTLDLKGTYLADAPLRSDLSSNVRIEATDFQIPGSGATLSMAGDIRVAIANGQAETWLNKDFTVSGPWPNSWPTLTAQSERFDLILSQPEQSSASIHLEQRANGYRVEADARAVWASPVGDGSLVIAGWSDLDASGLPQDFEFRRFSIGLGTTPTPFGAIAGTFEADGLKGPVGQAAGLARLNLQMAEGHFPLSDTTAATFESANIAMETRGTLDGLALNLDLSKATADIRGLAVGAAQLETPLKVDLSQESESAQAVVISLNPNAGNLLEVDMGFGVTPLDLTLDELDSALFLKLPSVTVEGALPLDRSALEGTVTAINADLSSSYGAIEDLSITVRNNENGTEGDYLARATRDADARPAAPRLALQGAFQFSQNIISNQIDITAPSGKPLGWLEGGYNLSNGYTSLRVTTGPLIFGGTGLSPSDLVPLNLPFIPVSGQLAIDGEIRQDESDTQSGAVFIQDLEVESSIGRFERINTVVDLTSVWPPQSAIGQTAAVGLIQAGVPITDTQVSFEVVPGALALNSVNMEFAGGAIDGGAMRINLDGSESFGEFAVTGIQMPEIARLSGLSGLETTGVLSGTIPVRISESEVYVLNGELQTEGPGVIRFQPDAATSTAAAGQGGMALAMEALENFEYDSISMRVNGSLNKALEATLAIKGRNPDLYGGYPIDFNLSLSGELANVLRDSLAGYRVPETIRQQLLAFPPSRSP